MSQLSVEEFKNLPAVKKKKSSNPESKLQSSCVTWFRTQYPKKILFAIPNGGKLMFLKDKKGKRYSPEAIKLKAEGMMPGVSDLLLMEPVGKYHGLWIEMKAGKNGLSEEQINFFLQAESRGYKCVCCRTYDEFEKEIIDYLK